MTLDKLIRETQAALGVAADGRPGPETWAAIHRRVVPQGRVPVVAPDTPPQLRQADARSEASIATLHPKVQTYARALVERAAARGIIIKIISGTRSYEEQNALYAQGRTKRGNKVTNARGGYSNHNFGIAFDVGVFTGSTDPEKAKTYVEEAPAYKAVAAIGLDLGLEWGGSWKSLQDQPHFQLRPDWAQGMTESQMLAELRTRKAAGKDAFAP